MRNASPSEHLFERPSARPRNVPTDATPLPFPSSLDAFTSAASDTLVAESNAQLPGLSLFDRFFEGSHRGLKGSFGGVATSRCSSSSNSGREESTAAAASGIPDGAAAEDAPELDAGVDAISARARSADVPTGSVPLLTEENVEGERDDAEEQEEPAKQQEEEKEEKEERREKGAAEEVAEDRKVAEALPKLAMDVATKPAVVKGGLPTPAEVRTLQQHPAAEVCSWRTWYMLQKLKRWEEHKLSVHVGT